MSYYPPYAGGQPLATQYDSTQTLLGQTNVEMNACQWQTTLPIQPKMVVQSYQPIQPVTPTSLPLVNTSIPLLQNQNLVHQPYQASSSTQYHQMLGLQTQNTLVNLQQPVSRIIYSQFGVPFYGMSQSQPSYTYQPNPSYPILGYNIGGQTPWQPQVQMPQTSFQHVSYPGFGQQNSQAFAMKNKPYLG